MKEKHDWLYKNKCRSFSFIVIIQFISRDDLTNVNVYVIVLNDDE
jgi:hypothetical protein